MDGWKATRYGVLTAGWLWLLVFELLCEAFGSVVLGAGAVIGLVWVCYSLADFAVFYARWRALAWLTVPAIPVFAVVLCVSDWLTGWPATGAKVWLCEGQLKAHVEQVPTAPELDVDGHRSSPDKRVGLFCVQESFRGNNGQVFLQTRQRGGIVYAPNGRSDSEDQHLYGSWYQWKADQ